MCLFFYVWRILLPISKISFFSQGSCSSTGSEGIFESVTKKGKRYDRRILRDKNDMDICNTPETHCKASTTVTGRKKAGEKTGKKKNTKTGPIERSRKSVWGNCPSYNFSDFDSFDLVVETSSEIITKKDSLEKCSLTKTPLSSHVQKQKNFYRSNVLRTPQIPEIPKVNLHAANAFSTSLGNGSLPNSPAIEISSSPCRQEISGYIHTSSPRVDSGFEADKSQSCNSSVDRCRLSLTNATPLADISAISNVSDDASVLQNISMDNVRMPSIDENSISDFSNVQNSCHRDHFKGQRTKTGGTTSTAMSTASPSVDQVMDDMIKLTEQLSLMNAAEGCNKKYESPPNHQTRKQYYTRQFAKSTKKDNLRHNKPLGRQCDLSKVSSCSSGVVRTMVTRSVTKTALSDLSYDASQ